MPEALTWILPILAGYVLGSIPFGYVIVRLLRGIDVRQYGSHNIGATNVLRVVGWGPALLTLLGDVGKGVLPPVIAARMPMTGGGSSDWVVVLATMAALYGHAYSLYFWLKERQFAKGKAVATGLGAVVGFSLTGHVSWWVLGAVGLTWIAVLLAPRLAGRGFGWVSLSSILAACALPAVTWATGARPPYVLFGLAAAVFVAWRHKENIGRLLDGVEPRIGERLPLAGVDTKEISCAFLIHAMSPEDWWQSRRFAWAAPLYNRGVLPHALMRYLILLCRVLKVDTVRGIEVPDGRKVQVHLLCVPWLPEQIKDHPRLALRRAVLAARTARELGASCLGLGAYWSVIGNKGQEVQDRCPSIPVTNGGAYTAGTIKQAVPTVFGRLQDRGRDPASVTAGVVGANGVVGFGICRQLLGRVAKLILIGTDQCRLEKSAGTLRRRAEKNGTVIEVTTDLSACRQAEILFTATSNAGAVLFPEHVSENTVIYDLGRPADVDESVLALPGVVVIPGGVVRPPGQMQSRLDVHFGAGRIPACMAETILIALDRCFDRVSLGDVTRSENVDYFVERAEQYGFTVVDEPETVPQTAAGGVACQAGTRLNGRLGSAGLKGEGVL